MELKNFYKFICFCFVGGIATIIDLSVFNVSSLILGKTYLILQISRILGIGVSMIWNFTVNRNITFKSRDEKIKKQLPKWLILYFITSLVNFIIFSLVIMILGNSIIERNIAFFCGIAVSIPLNFIGSLLWAFKKKS